MIRGIFKVTGIKLADWNDKLLEVTLSAIYDYSEKTPGGTITMYVDSSVTHEKLTVGKLMNVDFTPAE